jgi:hypoxanthine phosphoribosyltransferase
VADKTFLSANDLLEDAYRLALQVFESGYSPTAIIGVWRGGTPIAVAVHELLDYLGVKASHFPIRTSSYVGIGKRAGDVQVLGLEPIAERLGAGDRVLFVDDVFDTGLSIDATVHRLRSLCPPPGCPSVRVATTYFKPANNKTERLPDYYVHETEQWLVFPHELDGLSTDEILEHKPGGEVLRDVLSRLQRR